MLNSMPNVDLEDSQQNAFVQDYLSKFNEKYNIKGEYSGITDEDRAKWCDRIEGTIEQIQEIYSYDDHEKRKSVVSLHDADVAMHVLQGLTEQVSKGRDIPTVADIYQSLKMAYAFINATTQYARKTK